MKNSILLTAFALTICGCASMSRDYYQPPKYIYEEWQKNGASVQEAKDAMQSCGYKDVLLANDLTKEQAIQSEACMSKLGFQIDLKSYMPHNCYGANSPYLCNRFWGGVKPALQPATSR